jgi:hypothetical protein
MNPSAFIGRAPQQVTTFLKDHVEPALNLYRLAATNPIINLSV